MAILVTGGAGFIGSNFVHYLLTKYPDEIIVNLDKLTYAGNIDNLADIMDNPCHHFVHGSITDGVLIQRLVEEYQVESIVNFAAESHVDRSIHNPSIFIETNVMGTEVLLGVARETGIRKFVQVSTDEVYGTLGQTGYFTEASPLAPNNPYAASKAGADLLVRAYHETYGLDVNITRCSNNYGPYQFPEKLIPLMVTNALDGEMLPIYGDGHNVRDWLHVQDHCQAIDRVLRHGQSGHVYNIGGHNEYTNNEIVQFIVDYLAIPQDRIHYVQDRLGHDFRYAIDPTKIQTELGWSPEYSFEEGLKATIEWLKENRQWWEPLKERARW